MADKVRLYAQCHCKANTLHVDVSRSDLPLVGEFCHCDDCRHLTGMMAGEFAELPGGMVLFDEEKVPSSLAWYKRQGGRVRWYFCKTCGAHLVQSSIHHGEPNKWLMSMGTLYPLELDDGTKTTKLQRHSFVRYGRDHGGLTQYLPDGVPRFADGTSSVEVTDQGPTEEEKELIKKASEAPTMPLRCSCGNVQLEVHRPSFAPISEENKDVVVDDKWLWTFCLCNSCRATSGFDASCYFFAPYTHIKQVSASRSHPTDGLTTYSSYPGRQRHFCPTCGACIFFDREDRGDLCDTFLGTIDVPLAAMFSAWIHKGKKISFHAYAKNKALAHTLAKGFCPDQDLSLTEAAKQASADYEGALSLPDGQ